MISKLKTCVLQLFIINIFFFFYLSQYIENKKTLYLIMELGSTDLNNFIKKEVQRNECVKEPTRVYIWCKMLEAVKAIHVEGILKLQKKN